MQWTLLAYNYHREISHRNSETQPTNLIRFHSVEQLCLLAFQRVASVDFCSKLMIEAHQTLLHHRHVGLDARQLACGALVTLFFGVQLTLHSGGVELEQVVASLQVSMLGTRAV